jgi:UDP-GlcNAc:undecaprenyl-phosphate GlcNAc-1-phosphate transferase
MSDIGRFRSLTSVLLTPVLTLMIPIFDTCMVTITRKLSGRRISQGGRDHTSHRLVALGVSERRAVVMLYFFAAVSGALALMVRVWETSLALLLVPAFALLVVFLGLYLGKVRVYDSDHETKGYRLINAAMDFPYKRRIMEVLLDVVLVVLAYYGAYVLRWDGNLSHEQLTIFLTTLPIMIIFEMSCFLLGGVYRGLWHYATVDDLLVIVRSVLAGAVSGALVVFFSYRFSGPSRAVFLLNFLLLLVVMSASRLSFRLFGALIKDNTAAHPDAKPVLIYGAGDGGALLIREILKNREHGYAPIGFIDDDRQKAGRLIQGYRIFDSREAPEVIRNYGVCEILVASLKVPESNLEKLRNTGVSLRKVSIRIE